jgi:Tol biopolymer transport system component/DNA-binding winged helix-turn-helix (wHTH) protein
VSLEPKTFDVLRYLIEHRDRLVTKEELLDSVWADTFVTPNVLTRAVAQLRKALGDDAFEARIIETVSKRGYRFIATVTPHAAAPPRSTTGRSVRWTAIATLVVLALISAGAFLFFRMERSFAGPPPAAPPFVRFTTAPGYNGMGAISPDGRSLAYVSDRTGSLEIYVASDAFGSKERALTSDGANNMRPDWSPDGQWIAFHSRKKRGIWIVPATGGTPRQIIDVGDQPAWSPDGTQIAFTTNVGGGHSQSVIWTVSQDGAHRRQLTRVGDPRSGQSQPAWSPDGRFVAFAVSMAAGEPGIGVVSVADGTVTHVKRLVTSGAAHPHFSPDGKAIFWTEAQAGENRFLRMAIGNDGLPVGMPEVVRPFAPGLVDAFSIARDGTAVVSVTSDEWNIWTVDVVEDGASDGQREPRRLTNEVVRLGRPDYSPDGRIAYLQWTPGRPISSWFMNEDGTGRQPLLDPPTVAPEWTRDGKAIIAAHGQEMRYWRIDPSTGRGTPLGVTTKGMHFPRSSPDGTSVAYHVIQADGILNVWTRPLDGGPARQITFDNENMSFPAWSPDGRWLAVQMTRGEHTYMGIVPSSGGAVTQLVFEPGQTFIHSWSPDGKEIAFAGERDVVWNIYAVSTQTKKIRQFTRLASVAGYVRYPSWSPRGGRIAFERNIRTGSVWTGKIGK